MAQTLGNVLQGWFIHVKLLQQHDDKRAAFAQVMKKSGGYKPGQGGGPIY